MIRKLLFVTVLVLLTACGEDKNWYIGDWVVDTETSLKQAANLDKNQFSKLERRINRFKEFRVVLAKDSGQTLEPNGEIDESYSLVVLDNNSIKLTEEGDEVFLYKDNSAGSKKMLYFFFDGKAASNNKKAKIYLVKK